MDTKYGSRNKLSLPIKSKTDPSSPFEYIYIYKTKVSKIFAHLLVPFLHILIDRWLLDRKKACSWNFVRSSTRITFVNYETTSWYRVGKKSKPPTHFSPLFHPERKFWKGRRLRDGWQNDTRIRERCQTFSVLETRGGGSRALETEFYSRDGCRSFCLRYRCWQQAIRGRYEQGL